MADQHSGLGDWQPIQSPDGKVFYFNSRTNETSWVAPQTSSALLPSIPVTPMQESGPQHGINNTAPPSAHSNDSYPLPPNVSSYHPAPTSPQGSSFSHQPAHTFYAQHPSPRYRPPPPGPPAGNAYQPPQPPRPQSSGRSTSIKSLLGSAVKATLFPGQFDTSQTSTPSYLPQGPASAAAPGQIPPSAGNRTDQVLVNGHVLDQPSLLRLQMMGVQVIPGRYWYDPRSGAWGLESGPCLGAIAAGQSLGGPLRTDASGPSNTGVYINGRQIHALDAVRLQAMGVTPVPGRWWVEADGRFGLEGSLVTVGTLTGGQGSRGMGTGGSGSGSWSWSNGENFGGQGDGFGYVGGHDAIGRAWSVDYGNW